MPTTILTKDITEGKLNGKGIFDVWMLAIKEHLDQEYAKNRIKGVEYSNVYLGSVQTVMAQAAAFELQRHQAAAQADLIREQIKLTAVEIQKAEAEIVLTLKTTEKVGHEIKAIAQSISISKEQEKNVIAERDKIFADTAISRQQLINLTTENVLLTKQVDKVTKDTELVAENIKLAKQSLINMASENNHIQAQIAKVGAETALLIENANIARQTKINLVTENLLQLTQKAKLEAETVLITKNITIAVQTLANLITQDHKTKNEATLLAHKSATERSQYSDLTFHVEGNGAQSGASAPVTGIIGKQKSLYTAQTDGFARTAEHRVAKSMMDTWSVRNSGSPDDNRTNLLNKLSDEFVGKAVGNMLTKVGAQ